MSTNTQWDEIFRRDGRVFLEPAPMVIKFGEMLLARGARRVGDLGCGTGRHVVHLAQQGLECWGIDNAPTGLRLTSQWLNQVGAVAPLLLADSRFPLPFPDASFDGLLSTHVIHHARLEAVKNSAQEIRRIVRPGGLLLISVPFTMSEENHLAEEIEPGTYVPLQGSEKGLPHHIFGFDDLPELFMPCQVLEHSVIEGRSHVLIAERL